jgi:CBS domain-containing protein
MESQVSFPPPDQWKNLLRQTQAIEIVKKKHPKGLIKFSPNMTLYESLELLYSNNITSAPVINPHDQFLGIVDVMDIAGYILHTLRNSSPVSDFPSFEKVTQKFYETHVDKLISRTSKPPSTSESSSLQQVVTLFRLSQYFKPHRIPLIDSKGRLIEIVSQFDLVAFAHANKESLGEMLFKTVGELKLAKNVVMVRSDVSFSDGLSILYNNNISGMALVDEEGVLITNFSASDLRGIRASIFSNYNWTILDFLKKGTEKHEIRNVLTCKQDSTLDEVLNLIVSNHIHRVYIVNEKNQPLGIICLYDLLSLF